MRTAQLKGEKSSKSLKKEKGLLLLIYCF